MPVEFDLLSTTQAFPILGSVHIDQTIRENTLVRIEVILPVNIDGSVPLVAFCFLIEGPHIMIMDGKVISEDRRNRGDNSVSLQMRHDAAPYFVLRKSSNNERICF